MPLVPSVQFIQDRFTATGRRRLWSQADKHTQWPGEGVKGDAVFDDFYAGIVQSLDNATLTQAAMQRSGAALLDHIGTPVILVGHSQGGAFPSLIADARPDLAKALILLEPAGPPFRDAVFSDRPARAWGLSDVPLTYSPLVEDPGRDLVKTTHPVPDKYHMGCILQAEKPSPRQLVHLATKSILVVTSESGYHAQYDYCIVRYLRQAGCSKTVHVELDKIGIRGNGHMMFLEKNSRQVQRVLHEWIQKL